MGGVAAASLDDWGDAIPRKKAVELGGDWVLRFPTPERSVGTGEDRFTYSPLPDDSTALGAVDRCASPAAR